MTKPRRRLHAFLEQVDEKTVVRLKSARHSDLIFLSFYRGFVGLGKPDIAM